MDLKNKFIQQLESSRDFLLYKAKTASVAVKKHDYGTEAVAACKSISNLLMRKPEDTDG